MEHNKIIANPVIAQVLATVVLVSLIGVATSTFLYMSVSLVILKPRLYNPILPFTLECLYKESANLPNYRATSSSRSV